MSKTVREYMGNIFCEGLRRTQLMLAVYNHWTGLVDWTGGRDWWTDTKNHFYAFQ